MTPRDELKETIDSLSLWECIKWLERTSFSQNTNKEIIDNVIGTYDDGYIRKVLLEFLWMTIHAKLIFEYHHTLRREQSFTQALPRLWEASKSNFLDPDKW